MLSWFFKWLESRVDSFPPDTPQMPAKTTWGFIRFYTRPFLPLLFLGFILSVGIAIIEVRIFAYLGKIVDILATANRETFWQDHKDQLLFYGFRSSPCRYLFSWQTPLKIRACAATSPCAFAGWHIAICCGNQWSSSIMSLPDVFRPK
jgi:hypothetical protein